MTHIQKATMTQPEYPEVVQQGSAASALRDILGRPVSPEAAAASEARWFEAQKVEQGQKLDFSRPPADGSPYWTIEIPNVKGETSTHYSQFCSGAVFYDEAADEYATANVWGPLAFVPQRWFSGSFNERNKTLIGMQSENELRLFPPGMPLPAHVKAQVLKSMRDQASRMIGGSKGQAAVLKQADEFEATL